MAGYIIDRIFLRNSSPSAGFMRWITTPEGRAWDKKQRLMIEAEEMIRKGKGWLRNHS